MSFFVQEKKINYSVGLHGDNKDFLQQVEDLLRSLKPTDLHVTETKSLWYRIKGEMHRSDIQVPKGGVTRLMTDLFKVPGSFSRSNASCNLPNFPNRLRLRKSQSEGNKQLFVRLLPNRPPKPEELHIEGLIDLLKEGDKLTLRPGLIIVAGATGSGKSTTLACLLQEYLEQSSIHISTVEDPIEYCLFDSKGVASQREIPDDVATMAVAVRNSLREDPDIILVGEMRDSEVAKGVLEASETGHLVFTTLHASSTKGILERMQGLLAGVANAESRLHASLRWGIHLSLEQEKGGSYRRKMAVRDYLFAPNSEKEFQLT